MTANDLTEWIALFQPELTGDGQGGYRETVPDGLTADTPAHVRRLSATEIPASDQLAARERFDVTIRYEPGITNVWRVMWGGRYLDITGADDRIDRTRGAWLTLHCERKEQGRQ